MSSENTSDLVHIAVSDADQTPTVQEGDTRIDLTLLEGWDELDGDQKKYLSEFARNPYRKTVTAMQLGMSMTEVNRWFEQPDFGEVASQIQDIYTELLKERDYKDSVDSPKFRGRVIKSRERGSYTEKKEGDKHLHVDGASLSDFLKAIGSNKD